MGKKVKLYDIDGNEVSVGDATASSAGLMTAAQFTRLSRLNLQAAKLSTTVKTDGSHNFEVNIAKLIEGNKNLANTNVLGMAAFTLTYAPSGITKSDTCWIVHGLANVYAYQVGSSPSIMANISNVGYTKIGTGSSGNAIDSIGVNGNAVVCNVTSPASGGTVTLELTVLYTICLRGTKVDTIVRNGLVTFH